jgi:DNA recombination protein RmuC
MGPIWMLVGLAIGAVVTGLLVRRIAQAQVAELKSQLTEAAAGGSKTAQALDAALERESELKVEMLEKAGELNTELARLEAELDGERRASADKVSTLLEAREAMVAVAKESAGKAATDSGKQLVDALRSELKSEKVETKADFDKRVKAVEETVAPVKETLVRMEQTLTAVNSNVERSQADISAGLRGVVETQKEVRNEAGAIVRALRQPHTRGRWGEMHLKRLAERSGMSDQCDFTEQQSVDGENGLLRPDMLVHLPGGKEVVVDAKAPLGPYLDACDATEDGARKAHMKLYARGLRAHVKKLSGKDYSAQFSSAPDFVVMYVPGEHFFSGAVEVDQELIEDAAGAGVLIATPTTLIVLLKTIAYAWQQDKVAREALAIATLGRQLYDRLVTYLAHVDRVSKRLNSAVDAQNKAVGSLEHMVLPAARQFPELGAVAVDKQLPVTRQVNLTAREVQANDLAESATDIDRADVDCTDDGDAAAEAA